ncbi:MAG: hypothetical protein KF861_15835 [Planctomycetaceae bacterium]|nr:hypothetical protein [Planctomycetaceae bacterium]
MSRVSVSSVLIVGCLCGAVASAGVVGTYAVIAPVFASDNSPSVPVSNVAAGVLPVTVSQPTGSGLSPATQAKVAFVQNGAIVVESAVGADGTAQVAGLQTGPHSVFISGPEGFAAFGAWLNPGAPTPGDPGSLIDIAVVPPVDIPVVEQILESAVQGLTGGASAAPSYGSQPSNLNLPGSGDSELIQGYGFEMGPGGTVQGRIVQAAAPSAPKAPLAGLDVHFISGGQIVGQARTGANGLFEVSGLRAGVHSFVVAGAGSFLALGAEVTVPAPGVAARATELSFGVADETQTVAAATEMATVISASPVFPGDLQFLIGENGLFEGAGLLPPPGSGGGGFGGGTGGGFGGGGGFSGDGFGSLLGLAALGLAAAALADDNDNNNNVPPVVVSPAVP